MNRRATMEPAPVVHAALHGGAPDAVLLREPVPGVFCLFFFWGGGGVLGTWALKRPIKKGEITNPFLLGGGGATSVC